MGWRTKSRIPIEPDPFWAHTYFTDGHDLFRFVGLLGRTFEGVVAEFENCRSLDVLLVRIDPRSRNRLRPVSNRLRPIA